MHLDPDIRTALDAVALGRKPRDLESETLEFKEDRGSRGDLEKELADSAVCLANHLGGSIVVGVADKTSGSEALVGTDIDPIGIKKRIHELTEPRLLVDAIATEVQGARLVVIRVPEGVDVHTDRKGRGSRRVGTDCVPLTSIEHSRLREERSGVDPSARPSERGVDDVAPAAYELAREHLGRLQDERARLSRLGLHDMLRELGLLATDDRLTVAGDVLFCAAQRGEPRLVYHYRETPGSEPKFTERLSAPAIVAHERALELVAARRTHTSLSLPNGQQLDLEDFPRGAVDEAIANALIHRDYHVTGPVVVDHSPQVLEVTSPGPLVAGVTPQNILTHRSKPRNHRLAHAARALRLAEEVGLGVDRMYREMIASGKNVPTIESDESVTVTFVGGAPNKRIAGYVALLPEREREDVDTLLVLIRLLGKKSTSAAEMAPLLQKREEVVEATFRRLAGEVGMVDPTRGTLGRRHPRYRLRDEAIRVLGTAVSYNVRSTEEVDRKIIAHVEEYGRISNKTVRNLLSVDVGRAKTILGDSVKRGLLTKAGSGERGPGVEYEPGPNFPQHRRGRKAGVS